MSEHPRAAPSRISVVGNSGSGKSSFAGRLAERLDVPHVELDAIFHQPGWQPLDTDEFRRRVDGLTRADGWVVDGNYGAVLGLVWDRAETVVWLDVPRAVVMRQVTGRTLRRMLRREVLWNDNREPWSNLFRWDPEHSIIRWAWTRHRTYRERYAAAMNDPRWTHLRFVRLRSHEEAQRFLGSLAAATERPHE